MKMCLNVILHFYYCIHDIPAPRQSESLLAQVILMFFSAVRTQRTASIELSPPFPITDLPRLRLERHGSVAIIVGGKPERESCSVRFCQMNVILALIGLERNAPMNNND